MRRKAFHLIILLIVLSYLQAGCANSLRNIPDPSESIVQYTSTPASLTDDFEIERSEGIEIGSLIISAIEDYYNDFGIYPSELADLIPHYLQAIPNTSTSQEYLYIPYSGDFINFPYVLYFYGVSRTWACAYHPKYSEWECGVSAMPLR